MHERRFGADQAHRLDDPARKVWLPPAEVLGALNLRAGDTVADVGAGTGYFTLPMALAIGETGKVYAVDAQTEMLAHLQKNADESGLQNIEMVHAVAERSDLLSDCCDLYFLANVWHELDDCGLTVQEAQRVLKAGGKVAILDWRPDVEPEHGPPLAHRLGPTHAMESLRVAGFGAITYSNTGHYSWLVLAEKLP